MALPPTIAALSALVVSWRTSGKVDNVHKDINSRLTEMLEAVKKAAFAAGREDARATSVAAASNRAMGVKEGTSEEHARQKAEE